MTEESGFDCRYIWGILKVCKDDTVEVYPRGMRSMIAIHGKVKMLGDSAMIIETETNNLAIRYSEIRIIRVLKPKEYMKG